MKVALHKGKQLGFGSFGTVYEATETNTGRAVALKQSRVSLKVKRTLLQHEAQVLKFLSGHPAIPQVYGYGRIEHFELLSMQLLGQTLKEIVNENGPLPVEVVTEVADQLLSALNHIHGKAVVHRDIKPHNILLLTSGSWKVCLIDFGFAYPAPRVIPEAEYSSDPFEPPTIVFGTLTYASLNAHEGRKLTYRDDLESLAYTLLLLLRGNLPWSYYTKHGTILGQIRQVREQKRRSTGLRLATGFPVEFGELVEYARSLPAEIIPDYQEWREKLKWVAQVAAQDKHHLMGSSTKISPDTHVNPRPPPPIQPGQVALVKLISSATAEGYSIQAGCESAYIPDSRFGMPEWECRARPSVILEVEWDNWAKAYSFTVVTISGNRELEDGSIPLVPIAGPGSSLSPSPQIIVSPRPDWPLNRSHCYAFKRPTTFYCLPSQTTVPSSWTIDPDGIETLTTTLTPPRDPRPLTSPEDLKSLDSDTRNDAQLSKGYANLYAQVSPLTPAHIANDSVDWNSARSWFDECVKAARYYYRCDGNQWTYVPPVTPSQESADWNSYFGDDFEEWESQLERDPSLTLAPITAADDIQSEDVLEGLDEILLVG